MMASNIVGLLEVRETSRKQKAELAQELRKLVGWIASAAAAPAAIGARQGDAT